jgi:hypothetical protein
MTPRASHSPHRTDNRREAPRRASLRAVLLATSALVSAALPTAVAHADNGTWTGPASVFDPAELTDGANWSTTRSYSGKGVVRYSW